MKLEIGYNSHIEVRKEFYSYPGKLDIKIMYLSDLHLNRYSGEAVQKMIRIIREEDPSLILLGGDYVDTNRGLTHLETLLHFLSSRENVLAIPGNHDHFFGLYKIKNRMQENNIEWIENASVRICIKGQFITVDGNRPGLDQNNDDLKILCLHQPINIQKHPKKYHIALAGHLHGCQFVFWGNKKGLYPGRLFYRWNLLKKEMGNCYYYIGKGLGDTLPLRFNCTKEILVIHTKKEVS